MDNYDSLFTKYLKRFASSMNGRFWHSVNSFHSAPSRFDISELCIFGLSCAIFRRWPRDQTIKAFIGLFIWSDWFFISICDILSIGTDKNKKINWFTMSHFQWFDFFLYFLFSFFYFGLYLFSVNLIFAFQLIGLLSIREIHSPFFITYT